MKVTANSKRYYREDLDKGMWQLAADSIGRLNDIKFRMYDAHYIHTFYAGSGDGLLKGQTLYKYGISLGLNSYYANSMEPFVKGILKSQVTNHKNHIEDIKDEIASIRGKLSETEKDLTKKQALKESLVRFHKTGKWKRPYKKCPFKPDKDGMVHAFGPVVGHYLDYERQVEADIRRLKARCGNLTQAIRRREKKLENLKELPPKRAIFGSRALYRKKDTVGLTDAWRQEFASRRHKSITLSGRADAPTGSWIVKYNTGTMDLLWELWYTDKDGKKSAIVFPDFCPKTYTKEYMDAIYSHTSIGYTFEIKKDGNGREYIIVKAAFDIVADRHVNDCLMDGCIAMDLNVDRLAWSELDGEGHQLRHGVIPMKLEGLSASQAKEAAGRAVAILIGICHDTKKPLAMERLDGDGMRRKLKYGNKTKNRRVTQFAFAKVTELIHSRAARLGIGVIEVNPAYTSFAGKVLGMRCKGQSVHEAASWIIGLKAMGLFPDVPERFIGLAVPSKPRKKKPKDGGASAEPSKPQKPPAELTEEQKIINRWKCLYGNLSFMRSHLWFREVPGFGTKKEAEAWAACRLDEEKSKRYVYQAFGKPPMQEDDTVFV